MRTCFAVDEKGAGDVVFCVEPLPELRDSVGELVDIPVAHGLGKGLDDVSGEVVGLDDVPDNGPVDVLAVGWVCLKVLFLNLLVLHLGRVEQRDVDNVHLCRPGVAPCSSPVGKVRKEVVVGKGVVCIGRLVGPEQKVVGARRRRRRVDKKRPLGVQRRQRGGQESSQDKDAQCPAKSAQHLVERERCAVLARFDQDGDERKNNHVVVSCSMSCSHVEGLAQQGKLVAPDACMWIAHGPVDAE